MYVPVRQRRTGCSRSGGATGRSRLACRDRGQGRMNNNPPRVSFMDGRPAVQHTHHCCWLRRQKQAHPDGGITSHHLLMGFRIRARGTDFSRLLAIFSVNPAFLK